MAPMSPDHPPTMCTIPDPAKSIMPETRAPKSETQKDSFRMPAFAFRQMFGVLAIRFGKTQRLKSRHDAWYACVWSRGDSTVGEIQRLRQLTVGVGVALEDGPRYAKVSSIHGVASYRRSALDMAHQAYSNIVIAQVSTGRSIAGE
eukprot:542875-Rhodomonas_salina.2